MLFPSLKNMWNSEETEFDVPKQCLKGKEISNSRRISEFPNFLLLEVIIYIFEKSPLSARVVVFTQEFLSGIVTCVRGREVDDENGPHLPWRLTVTLYWHPVLQKV